MNIPSLDASDDIQNKGYEAQLSIGVTFIYQEMNR
jgi:hypothetical protein